MKQTVRVPVRLLRELKLDEHYRKYRTVLPNDATRFVPGEGNPMPKVVIIGEAPGEDEERLGRPFIGKSGNLLSKVLKSAGLSRQDVFITNLIKHRPPGNADPTEKQASAARVLMQWELAILKPKVVVPMGKFASRIFYQHDLNMNTMAGTCRMRLIGTDQHAWVCPQYHPSAALRSSAVRARLYSDFNQVIRALEM